MLSFQRLDVYRCASFIDDAEHAEYRTRSARRSDDDQALSLRAVAVAVNVNDNDNVNVNVNAAGRGRRGRSRPHFRRAALALAVRLARAVARAVARLATEVQPRRRAVNPEASVPAACAWLSETRRVGRGIIDVCAADPSMLRGWRSS